MGGAQKRADGVAGAKYSLREPLLIFPLLDAEVQRKKAFLSQEANPGTSAGPFSVDNSSWLL